MPVTISGSSGISGVDGSAGNPALAGSDADTGIFISAGQISASLNGVAGNVPLVSGTVNAGGVYPFPSSGGPTSVGFSGIPSWVKRITVMFSGVSTSGTNSLLVQLGTSSGIENTGYTSTAYGQTNMVLTSTVGFILNCTTTIATDSRSGVLTISNLASDIWVASGTVSPANGQLAACAGTKNLIGVLDRLRIIGGTLGNPVDVFDAGSINIFYE